jgi:membrane fusion protein (multidrug efflux system)
MAEDTQNEAAGPPSGAPGADAKKARPRKKGKGGIVLLVAVLVVAGLGFGYWYFKLRGVISTDDAYIDGDRATVTTKMLGRIDTMGADEGDTVQTGQLLIHLDDADLRAHLAQATAQLDLARKSVKLAQVNEKKAQDDYDRAEVQLKGNAIPKEQFDHAQTSLESAQAEYQIALAKVETARSALGVIQQQISDTRVTAPFHGVVAKRWLLPGDVVQPGQPVYTVYDLDSIWVTAVFEETKLRYLPIGTQMDLSVDAYPDQAFSGSVTLIGAAAASQFSLIPPNNASGNFTKVTQRVPVRISIARDGGSGASDPARLLPGMSVVATVHQPE